MPKFYKTYSLRAKTIKYSDIIKVFFQFVYKYVFCQFSKKYNK